LKELFGGLLEIIGLVFIFLGAGSYLPQAIGKYLLGFGLIVLGLTIICHYFLQVESEE